MNPGASLIIVTFNSASSIADCLTTVMETIRPIDEVLIIDNDSQDETLRIVEQILPPNTGRVRLFPQSKNTGFSKGCNIGIEHSNKEFVILLNPDTQVFGDWIQRLTAHFKYYPKTGAVGPLSNQCLSPQHIRTYFPDYKENAASVFELLDILHKRFDKRSLPKKLLMGFCMVLRRDLIQKLGPLDEDFFLGKEDIELSWRLRENGYTLRVALDVFINHQRQTSFKTLPKSHTDKFVQEGADALFAKMQRYYKPAKVPHPRIYFNIDWWRPPILQTVPEEDVFDLQPLEYEHHKIIPCVQKLLKNNFYSESIKLLEDSLRIIVDDYLMWFTLGSIYLIIKDFKKAELALKNAWAYEDADYKAKEKLLALFSQQNRLHEAKEFFGDISC